MPTILHKTQAEHSGNIVGYVQTYVTYKQRSKLHLSCDNITQQTE